MHPSRIIIGTAAVLMLGACSTPTDDPTSGSTSTTQSSPTQSAVSSPSVMDASSEPAPSPGDASPTVTASDAGPDEAEAYTAAVPAFREYWDVVNETYAAGGSPEATARMKETMTGVQLDFWERTFADWARQDRSYEGENVVMGASVKFLAVGPDGGKAEVEYCVDMSETTAYDAAGDPLEKDGNFQEGAALLEWVDGRWKVSAFTAESGVVASC